MGIAARPRISSSSSRSLCFWLMLALMFNSLPWLCEGNPIGKSKSKVLDLNRCLNASEHLLSVVNDTWFNLQERWSNGFNCTYESVNIKEITEKKASTLNECLAIAPLKNGICGERSGNPLEEQNKCLKAIHDDLKAYKEEMNDDKTLLLGAINNMIMAFNFPGEDKQTSLPSSSSSKSQTFAANLRQCKIILALRLRIVTITRIINYLKSSRNSS